MSKPRTFIALLRSPAQSVVLPLTAQVPPASHGILREGATRLEAVSPMDAVAKLLTGDQLLDGIAADTLEPINSRVISALTSDALPMAQSARNFAASFRWRMSRSSDVDNQDAGKRRGRKRRDHADLEAPHRDHGGCRKYGGAPIQRRQEREIWCKAKKLDRADLPEDDVKREPERQVHHDANDRRGDRRQHGREPRSASMGI